MTLLLNASAVNELIADLDEVFDALETGFRQSAASTTPGRKVRTDLPAEGTATALLPGLIPGIPAYTVKVNAKFPAATPALRGLVCLHAIEDGELLAVIDSSSLTALRTGLAAALATDVIANADATRVGVVGAGAQAHVVLRGLAHRRSLAELIVYDLEKPQAVRLVDYARRELGLDGGIAGSPCDVAATSDIVLLATWSKTPLLRLAGTHGGQHLTSLGVDEPGKQELAPEILTRAVLIVDDRHLATTMGAIANANLPKDTIDATLPEILLGQHPGRSSAEEVTVYTAVGLAWQDLALAWRLYECARTDEGRLEYDFVS